MSPFQPQPVHPDDIHKFPSSTPSGVIFASDSEINAKIFAALRGVCSFGTIPSEDNKKLRVMLYDRPDQKLMDETVYIFTFSKDEGNWEYIRESGEWYCTEEQTPTEIRQYTREQLYNELRENPELIFQEDYQEKESIPIS